MGIFFLNKFARKFKRYFKISILFYLIVSNDLVLGKGGGKGGKSGGSKGGSSGGDGVDVSKNKVSSSDKTSSTSYTPSGNHSSKSSSWVFFYYGGNGQRSCGNLCILTAVLVPIIILFIIGCGIWRCYRIRKRNRTDKIKNKIEADENDSHTNSYNNSDSTTSPYYPPPVASPYNSSYYHSPTYYSTPKNDFNYTPNYLDDNYTNYAPGHNKLSPPPMELNQVKNSSRRESFDSMDEVRKNKK